MRKARNAACPHWPGDTHACPVARIIATSPKLVGLKMCLPRQRTTNLLAIVTAAPRAAIVSEFVRRRRHSDSPEISGLRGSNAGRRQRRVQSHCVASAVASIVAACAIPISKSSQTVPYSSSVASMAIW